MKMRSKLGSEQENTTKSQTNTLEELHSAGWCVHPQSRKCQTDSATVQGHLVHPGSGIQEASTMETTLLSLAIDAGLVPGYPLQKLPSRELEGSGARE